MIRLINLTEEDMDLIHYYVNEDFIERVEEVSAGVWECEVDIDSNQFDSIFGKTFHEFGREEI